MEKHRIDTFLKRTTLRQIAVIVALAEHDPMTDAARTLGISVSAVSRMAKRFEINTGICLFDGPARGAVLRFEARQLVDQLRPVRAAIDTLETGLADVEP